MGELGDLLGSHISWSPPFTGGKHAMLPFSDKAEAKLGMEPENQGRRLVHLPFFFNSRNKMLRPPTCSKEHLVGGESSQENLSVERSEEQH